MIRFLHSKCLLGRFKKTPEYFHLQPLFIYFFVLVRKHLFWLYCCLHFYVESPLTQQNTKTECPPKYCKEKHETLKKNMKLQDLLQFFSRFKNKYLSQECTIKENKYLRQTCNHLPGLTTFGKTFASVCEPSFSLKDPWPAAKQIKTKTLSPKYQTTALERWSLKFIF